MVKLFGFEIVFRKGSNGDIWIATRRKVFRLTKKYRVIIFILYFVLLTLILTYVASCTQDFSKCLILLLSITLTTVPLLSFIPKFQKYDDPIVISILLDGDPTLWTEYYDSIQAKSEFIQQVLSHCKSQIAEKIRVRMFLGE